MSITTRFTIRDIADIIKGRQDNKFDARIAAVGDTGDGKSTLLSKILYKVGKFNPKKHQVYNQKDVIRLLTSQIRGKCFDDEGINTGYKRDWQNKDQQKKIKILTNYRDNLNVYACALPNFFSLDKDIRDLFCMVLHVVERGMAVVHLPLQGNMYSQDKWDAKNNGKTEDRWNERRRKNPNFRVPYHRLSTFAGYLFFTDMTDRQKELYERIKREKRAEEYEKEEGKGTEESFNDKVYKLLIEGKLSREGLVEICVFSDKKYNSVLSKLSGMLTDNGIKKTASKLFAGPERDNSSSSTAAIKSLVPDFPQ